MWIYKIQVHRTGTFIQLSDLKALFDRDSIKFNIFLYTFSRSNTFIQRIIKKETISIYISNNLFSQTITVKSTGRNIHSSSKSWKHYLIGILYGRNTSLQPIGVPKDYNKKRVQKQLPNNLYFRIPWVKCTAESFIQIFKSLKLYLLGVISKQNFL